MSNETPKLQPDPPEGDRATIERELQRQNRKNPRQDEGDGDMRSDEEDKPGSDQGGSGHGREAGRE